MKKLKKVVIDRSKWLTGSVAERWLDADTRIGPSCLLDDSGFMCCLGFVSAACGVSRTALESASAISGLTEKSQKKVPGLLMSPENLGIDSELAGTLMSINDKEHMRPGVRERMIKKELRKAGVSVRFVGKRPRVFRDQPENK